MKKKILLLLFIFFISISNSDAVNINRKQVSSKQLAIESINDKQKWNKVQKINFKDKKVLKKEIQKRKRYHKNLLSQYNSSFDAKYLNMITDNGIIINNLRKYYEFNFIT